MVHLVWTEYSIGLARFMAPLTILPIIPTEIVAGKLNVEHKEKGSPSEDDDEEPRAPKTGGQKKFPPEVKIHGSPHNTNDPLLRGRGQLVGSQ